MCKSMFAVMCLTLFAVTFVHAQEPVSREQNSRPRVFVEESDSWEITGGGSSTTSVVIPGVKNRDRDGRGGRTRITTSSSSSVAGGARPQTAEIIKTFNRRCPTCIITMKRERADYFILLEHEGGKDLISRDNKFALYNREGDVIASGSTRTLGNAVKDACAAIQQDWRPRSASANSNDAEN